MNYLIIIIGPTAIGKTALSIALAKHFDCEIISCDSRQFFKDMKIGTAVPNEEELAAATHHFIQNKSIFENYSVGNFEQEALAKLDELFQKKNVQIMVGGSGLYVDAVLKGFDEFPEIDGSVRNEINTKYETLGIEYLKQQLQKLDLEYYNKLSNENPQTLQNPQRMKRFVEVCIGTGKPYSSFIGILKNTRNFTPIIIGLEAERAIMYDRINKRVDKMMQEGLLEEVKSLYSNKNLNALQTVGYRELFDYLDRKTTLDFAVEQIKMNTRRFAKRQITWFKRTENAVWFDYLTDTKEIISNLSSKILNSKNMPISPNFTSIFEQEFEINFLQCYPNGLLKYTDLCNILQITAGIHADLGGISFSDMQAFHQAWVLSRMRLEITNLPKWKEKITVKTWINSLENSRSTRCLELYCGAEKLVGCETFWVVMNTQTRKPENLALPHEHFTKFPENNATEKRVQKINLGFDFEEVSQYNVQLSDIDIVNHANNVKYLEWCLNVIDIKLILKQKIKGFEMNFLKELNLNDAVIISNCETTYTISKDEKVCFALDLIL